MDVTLIYGVPNISESQMSEIRDGLKSKGCTVASESKREIKTGINEVLEKHRACNNVVLILSRFLERKAPYTVKELNYFVNMIPNIKVILILSDDTSREVCSELFSNGFFLGLFSGHSDVGTLTDLIIKGRSSVEARRYYKLGDEITYNAKISLEQALTYITQSTSNPSEYLERARYVEDHLYSKQKYGELLHRLPEDIKLILSKDEAFSNYLSDFIDAITVNNVSRDDVISKPLLDAEFARTAVTRALRMSLIGVSGTQSHIGCTHQALLIASYLKAHGFRVAVIEYALQDHPSFFKIASGLELSTREKEYFTYRGIDYYPQFNFSKQAILNEMDYNFVVCDFGSYTEGMMEDFTRCALQIIVSGSKEWELDSMENIFNTTDKKQHGIFNYLFLSAPNASKIPIMHMMRPLKKIYFGDYQPNPFSTEGYKAISMLLSDYVILDHPVKKTSPVICFFISIRMAVKRFFE